MQPKSQSWRALLREEPRLTLSQPVHVTFHLVQTVLQILGVPLERLLSLLLLHPETGRGGGVSSSLTARGNKDLNLATTS
jgi:hypothetical protein